MRSILKVLIVENDIISALLLFHYLKLFGRHCCHLVASGEEAVRIADAERPDAILMDIDLAGNINGIEAAKRIIRKNSNAAIAFLTSCDDCNVMEEAEKVSPIAYLIKPVKLNKIRELLESINISYSLPPDVFNEPCGILRGLSYEKK